MKTKDLNFKLKSLGEDGTFTGYCSLFDEVDSYGDVVKKGAFLACLNDLTAHQKTLPVLWQHDRRLPIGVWQELYEDDKGLYGKGKLLIDDVAQACEAYALIKAGAINGLSIGYNVQKWLYDKETGLTDLLEIDLKEISIVTFPACDSANITTVKARQDQDTLAILKSINQKF